MGHPIGYPLFTWDPMGLPMGAPWDFPWDALWDPWNTGTTQEHGKARGKAHRIPWEAPWDVLCYITWGTL